MYSSLELHLSDEKQPYVRLDTRAYTANHRVIDNLQPFLEEPLVVSLLDDKFTSWMQDRSHISKKVTDTDLIRVMHANYYRDISPRRNSLAAWRPAADLSTPHA